MSIAASQLVWEHSRAKGVALLVLLKIADFTNQDGIAYPGLERLADDCRLSVTALLRHLKTLTKLGEIIIKRRAGKYHQNVYHLMVIPADSGRGTSDSKVLPNPLGTGGEKRKTNTSARSQSSRAGSGSGKELRYWGDGCPEFKGDPVRIDSAGSPKPRVPKPSDPLMQARAKPKPAADCGGPLFGEPEKPKPPSDEVIVRDAFHAAYVAKHGIKPAWTGAEAKRSKDLMRMVREAAEQRSVPPEELVARVCVAFLADPDPFLETNAYRFLLLYQRAPKYLTGILKLGRKGSSPIRTGSW